MAGSVECSDVVYLLAGCLPRRMLIAEDSHVPRVISFIVLLATVLLVGAVFFQVMAQFIVPLFLACVLLVVSQPLHAWTRKRITTHQRWRALITTVLVLLFVLLPLTLLGLNAYQEFRSLLRPNESQPESQSRDRRSAGRCR